MFSQRVQDILRAAFAYSRAGLSVIPIGKDKRPLCPWKPYQQHRPDEIMLCYWFAFRQFPNLAIVSGAASGGLLVLDFDYDARRIYQNWQAEVGRLAALLPTVQTGKGIHVYLRTAEPGGNRQLAVDAAGRIQIETRGEGGYVIAPPSRHPSGRPYRWIQGDHHIPLLSPVGLNKVLTAAGRFDERQRIGSRQTPSTSSELGRRRDQPGQSSSRCRLRSYATTVLSREAKRLQETPAGQRNEQLNRAAFKVGRYVGAGLLDQRWVEEKLAAACGPHGNRLIPDDGQVAFQSTLQSGLQADIVKPVDTAILLNRLSRNDQELPSNDAQ